MKTWAVFAWAILLSNANATVNLPGEYEIELIFEFFKLSIWQFIYIFLGIDVLSSGYDAATWTSKYSIFDFKEEGETVHIISINKTYTAPAMVNVVTDGMNSKRVEDSCIDVATHFEGDSNFFVVTSRIPRITLILGNRKCLVKWNLLILVKS